jgi:uncharacterized membrane protein YjjP (DUF1212 family)
MPHKQNWESQKFLAREEALITCILDLGEMLLASGAEVKRVEDTITRLCSVYAFVRVDVFTITSSIVLTVRTPGGRILTQTRRILARDTDLGRVEKVNALSRQLCAQPVPLGVFQQEVARLRRDGTYPVWVQRVMYIVISAAFCLFFGGAWQDALCAAAVGLIVRAVEMFFAKFPINRFVATFVLSTVGGVFVNLSALVGLAVNADLVGIGTIMLLIPGMALTNAARDLFSGDTICGLLRFVEVIMVSTAIAAGFGLAGILLPV